MRDLVGGGWYVEDGQPQGLSVSFEMGRLVDPPSPIEGVEPVIKRVPFVRMKPKDMTDHSIVVRPATEADKRTYAREWAAFQAAIPAKPRYRLHASGMIELLPA